MGDAPHASTPMEPTTTKASTSNHFPCLSLTPQHAPGVPKILVGNRLHLAFKRQVPTEQAQAYAERLGVTFFEVSPLCNFNVTESFTELARVVLLRHGMDRLWRPSKGRCQLGSPHGPPDDDGLLPRTPLKATGSILSSRLSLSLRPSARSFSINLITFSHRRASSARPEKRPWLTALQRGQLLLPRPLPIPGGILVGRGQDRDACPLLT